MKKLMLCLSVLALALAGAACKKSAEEAATDLCNTKSKCEKEEAPSADEIKECQEALSDKDCGAQARAMMECTIAKETCTPEGKSDNEAAMVQCGEQFGKYMECMAKKAGETP
ncbi:MAG: hypothetical protein JXB32_02105 [Deltaproteobacteria bacterium]|nr:hypothetical protein [Deltaproteobacteria bacterium]